MELKAVAVPSNGAGAAGGTPTPLVVACLRFTDLRPGVDPLTGAVARDVRGAGWSAADAAALEHALQVAEAWSGRVLAVCAGPPAAEAALREAAAVGAQVLRIGRPGERGDGGSHGPGPGRAVEAEPLGSAHRYLADLAADEGALAAVLVAGIRTVGEPALVLCGDRSADRGTGALPALLAHKLGAAQALGLVALRPTGDALLAERRLDGGRRERLRVPSPAVCSVEAAGVRLRRASLPATLAAARMEVPVAAVDSVSGPAAASRVRVVAARPYHPRPRVVPPPSGGTARERLLELTGALATHEPPTIVGPSNAAEAADALLAFLERNGYLAAPPAMAPTGTRSGGGHAAAPAADHATVRTEVQRGDMEQ